MTHPARINHPAQCLAANRFPRGPRHAPGSQRGNAVLFTLLAMVIGGVVVAVGISQYQDADRSASVQATVAEVNSIIGNAKQNYGQYSYVGLTTAVAVGSRVIPANLQATATTANNKFGGAISLNTGTAPGAAVLEYAAVPQEVCTSIVNGTQGMAQQVSVAGTLVKATGGGVNVATLNAQCTSAAAVSINWEFGRS